jgi:hypothetical protein
MRCGYGTITRIFPHPKDGYEKIEGFFVYPLNCASVSITFAKVIPPDPLPEEVGERFEFSWIVPKDRLAANLSKSKRNCCSRDSWNRSEPPTKSQYGVPTAGGQKTTLERRD